LINKKKGRLTEEEITKIVEEAEKYKSADAGIAKKIQAKNDLESYTYQMRNTLDDPKFKQQIKEVDRNKVKKVVEEIVSWIDHNPNAELEEYQHKKKELEEMWKPIIINIYGQGSGSNSGSDGDGYGGDARMPNMGNFDNSSFGGPQIDEVD